MIKAMGRKAEDKQGKGMKDKRSEMIKGENDIQEREGEIKAEGKK